jgi:hypothetical protein
MSILFGFALNIAKMPSFSKRLYLMENRGQTEKFQKNCCKFLIYNKKHIFAARFLILNR